MIPTRRLALVAVVLAAVLFAYPGDAPGGTWASLVLLNGILLLIAALGLLSIDWIGAQLVPPLYDARARSSASIRHPAGSPRPS